MPRAIVKVRRVGDSLIVTIPKFLTSFLEWGPGDRVMVGTHGDGLLVVKEGDPDA